MTQRYFFALDLINDEKKIAEYEQHHRELWPEVRDGFVRAGISNVELYRTGNRLCMMLETDEHFSFERKKQIDDSDPVISKWETLMSSYQLALPWAAEGERWVMMSPVYRMNI